MLMKTREIGLNVTIQNVKKEEPRFIGRTTSEIIFAIIIKKTSDPLRGKRQWITTNGKKCRRLGSRNESSMQNGGDALKTYIESRSNGAGTSVLHAIFLAKKNESAASK
jgi:hypothetical protein